MLGVTALMQRSAPKKFVSMTRRKSPIATSSTDPPAPTPALFHENVDVLVLGESFSDRITDRLLCARDRHRGRGRCRYLSR
jgi:hypothetical protein